MRNAFAQELLEVAAADDRVVLLSGDIGNRMFDSYKARFPARFFNCGVAEANMMSVAAGMALCGLRPIVYTIVPFATTRCLEQIRVDVCYHRTPVIVVGVGGGLSYAGLGATHHSCEDIALMRSLPEMTVICPGDSHEVRLALRNAIQQDGPIYVRLGKKGEPNVHDCAPDFSIGRAICVREGDDVALIATGNMLPTAVAVAEQLSRTSKLSVQVVSMHTVKPLDEDCLAEIFSRTTVVATIEEHSVIGGLGGAVAEWLATQPPRKTRLLRIGTSDSFLHEAGDQQHARRRFGLSPDAIANRVSEFSRSDARLP
jgi:transketolase